MRRPTKAVKTGVLVAVFYVTIVKRRKLGASFAKVSLGCVVRTLNWHGQITVMNCVGECDFFIKLVK